MAGSVRVEAEGFVTTITIDRPKAMNALDAGVLAELEDAFTAAATTAARAVILTGAGDKAFVAGADIAAMAPMDPLAARVFSERGQAVCGLLEEASFVSIAAVNGYALGGGTELALACDIRIASENARFGLPEVGLGVIPGFGGTQRLSRIMGLGPALDLVVTGRRITAAEAHRLGIVSDVVPREALLAKAKEVATSVARNGPVAVALAKRAVRRGFGSGLQAGLQIEAAHFAACFATTDQKEGMKAFLEKRPAEFKGQ